MGIARLIVLKMTFGLMYCSFSRGIDHQQVKAWRVTRFGTSPNIRHWDEMHQLAAQGFRGRAEPLLKPLTTSFDFLPRARKTFQNISHGLLTIFQKNLILFTKTPRVANVRGNIWWKRGKVFCKVLDTLIQHFGAIRLMYSGTWFFLFSLP